MNTDVATQRKLMPLGRTVRNKAAFGLLIWALVGYGLPRFIRIDMTIIAVWSFVAAALAVTMVAGLVVWWYYHPVLPGGLSFADDPTREVIE